MSDFTLISIEEARAHLRVGDDTSNDGIILLKLEGATDIAESFVNRMLRERSIMLTLATSPEIVLKITPINSIKSISYINDSGEVNCIDPNLYGLRKGEYESVILIRELPLCEVITVTLHCGYTPELLPPSIKMAILYLLGTLYDNESDNMVGRTVSQLPLSAERILAPWRINPY